MTRASVGARLQKIIKKAAITLTRRRYWLRGSYGEYLLAVLLFVIATVILTNFVALNITSQLFTPGPGDATAGFLWLNFADPGLSPFLNHTDLANYPSGQQLGSATFVTYLALWLPMRFLSFFFGPIAALNLVTFFGFISAGLSMYWLVKRLSNSWLAALFAGYATAFVPYAIGKSSAHIAYIFSIVFVLMLASFIALWSRPTGKRGVLFGLTVALGFYTDGYYVLLGAVMAIGLCFSGVLQGILLHFKWSDYWVRTKALIAALVTLAVLSAPIAYVQFAQGEQVRGALSSSRPDIEPEIRAYRSNIMDFIVPPASNPLFKDNETFKQIQAYKNLRSNSSENLNYVGFTVILLIAVGLTLIFVWLVFRKRSSLEKFDPSFKIKYLLVGSVVVVTIPLFLTFMFSPEVVVRGVTIPLPGKLFIDYDIALWRVMSRFFVPLHAIAVLFASLTLGIVVSKIRPLKFGRQISAGVGIAAILVMAAEFATLVNRPSFSFVENIPATYKWLAKQDDVRVVVEAPIVYPHDVNATRYFTAQVIHRKKLVNEKEVTTSSLLNNIGSVGNPEMIDWAYARGAEVIVAHGTKCDEVKWGELLYQDYSDRFGGQICTYKLVRPMTQDRTFAKFSEGFKFFSETEYHPWGIGLEKTSTKIDIVDDQLRTRGGEVQMTASLSALLDKSIDGVWELRQKSRTVATGRFYDSNALLEGRFDASVPVELIIVTDNGQYMPSGLKITKTTVTSF